MAGHAAALSRLTRLIGLLRSITRKQDWSPVLRVDHREAASIFLTGTTGTLTRNYRVHRVGVPVVPASTIDAAACWKRLRRNPPDRCASENLLGNLSKDRE